MQPIKTSSLNDATINSLLEKRIMINTHSIFSPIVPHCVFLRGTGSLILEPFYVFTISLLEMMTYEY